MTSRNFGWYAVRGISTVAASLALAMATAHAQDDGPGAEDEVGESEQVAPLEEPEPEPLETRELEQPEVAVPDPAPTCAAQARDAALDAVVRVRSGATWGAGFVYRSTRHVVTSFRIVSLGRDVTVVARDGTRVGARVVARDESYDLALLELASEVPALRMVEPAPETSAMVGRPVVALGHPFAGVASALGERGEGLLRWSVSQGTIGALNANAIQADVALNEGHAGGPLLDCEGRVLGMIAGAGLLSPGLGLVARMGRVDELVERAGGGDFLGDLRLRFGIGGVLLIDQSGRVAAGGYLTLGATLFDRVSWMNRVGILFGGTGAIELDELSANRQIIRVESMLGWRFFIDIGGFTTVYLVPSIGASVMHESESRRGVTIAPVEGCTPSATESCVVPRIVEARTEAWRVRPAVGLTIILGGTIEVGYTLEIHVEDPVTTFHAVNLGLLF